jgi:NitT/TauT family transport system ATP-binding protein
MLDAAALYPRQLSGGMQRRVALARAIVHRPRLLLLDEPFVSLDQPSVMELHELLRAYWEREAPTVLMVSHSLDESIALAQRLLFLGGAPATLIHEYSVALPATRTVADEAVRRVRERLLEAQPALLSGRLRV